MIAALLTGVGLGLTAGISPGPLFSLVISTTLARGFAAGVRVAAAPMLSDLLVVPLCVLVIGSLPSWFEPALSIAGGLFVIWLGVRMVLDARHATLLQPPLEQRSRVDLQRGALVNFLSPHPWIFWMTVGAPLLVNFWAESLWDALLFVLGFYLLLVASKVAIAGAVAAAIGGAQSGMRPWLTDRSYALLLLASAVLLLIFGVLLLIQGVRGAL